MKKKFELTEEEFEAITEAITSVLSLWNYDIIEVTDRDKFSMAMHKDTFFQALRDEFIIK